TCCRTCPAASRRRGTWPPGLENGTRIWKFAPPVRRFIGQAMLLAVLIAGTQSASGEAGTMTLYSCHTPSGRTVGTAGWSLVSAFGAPTRLLSSDDCAKGPSGTLIARIGGSGATHTGERLI